jgi:plastocyanin
MAALMALASIAGLALVDRGDALADASLTFQPSPTSASCSSSSTLDLTVRDTSGNLVANGTPVTFATTLGYITTSRATTNGVVSAVLVIPDKISGTANVTASAIGLTAQRAVAVSCQSAPSAPVQTVAPAAPAAPVVPPAPAGPAPAAPAPAAAAQQVGVRNFAYSPATLSAQVGQSVTVNVTNSGPAPHTFTIDGLTDSGSIANGTSKSVTFTPTQARTYTFYCTIHGAAVMSGTLTVGPGGTTTATSTSTSSAAPAPAPAPSSGGGGYY